jgi:hypothetical protein
MKVLFLAKGVSWGLFKGLFRGLSKLDFARREDLAFAGVFSFRNSSNLWRFFNV